MKLLIQFILVVLFLSIPIGNERKIFDYVHDSLVNTPITRSIGGVIKDFVSDMGFGFLFEGSQDSSE